MKYCILPIAIVAILSRTLAAQPTLQNESSPVSADSVNVVFQVADSIGQKRLSGFTVYDGSRIVIGSHELYPEDLKNPSRFILTLKNRLNRVAVLLVNRFDKDLQDEIDFYSSGDTDLSELIQSITRALNELLSGPVLYNPADYPEITSKVTDTTIRQELQIGKADAPASRHHLVTINRLLLESAFPGDFARSHSLGSSDNGELALDPGIYWFVSNLDPSLIKRAEIQSNQVHEIAVQQNRGLWLNFTLDSGRTIKHHLFVPRDTSQMRQALAQMRFPQSFSDQSFIKSLVLRPGVDPTTLDEARDVALNMLPEVTSDFDPPSGISLEQENHLFFERDAKLTSCQQILAVAGRPQDTQPIVELFDTDCHYKELHHWAATIARIESRHNHLSHGTLISLLNNKNPRWVMAAAIQLHLAGLSDGDETLRNFIANPPELFLAEEAAMAMLDCSDERTLSAVRALAKRCLSFFEANPDRTTGLAHITAPVCLYLLAQGNEDDRRLVSQFQMLRSHIFGLSFLAENPLQLAEYFVDSERKSDHDMARRLGAGFRDRDNIQHLQVALFDMLRNKATSAKQGLWAERAAFEAMERNHLFCSYYFPSSLVVRKLGGFAPILVHFEPLADNTNTLLSKTDWLPRPKHLDEYVDNWLNGHTNYLAQLEYFETAAIADSVQRRGNGKVPMAFQSFQAQHRIGTTGGSFALDNYPVGIDRRAYLFVHQGTGNHGGIFGIAELRFDIAESGDALNIRLKLDQRAHYDGGAIFGQRVDDWSAWPHHRYVVNSGRELVQGMQIRNTQQNFSSEFIEQEEDGTLLFRAKLPKSDSMDWYLDVNLNFVDQTKTLTYSLTSGENARYIRRQIDQAMSVFATGIQSINSSRK